MGKKLLILFLLVLQAGFAQTPDELLKQLMEGNTRYINDKLLYPNQSSARREEVQEKQHPFAAILGCSDSRVAPEIIFDQGLGDLFIVRVAGNVAGPVELDSVEYSIKHLGATLIVVLGHQSCGAVTAIMEGQTADIEAVARLIEPAVKGSKTTEEAIKANVRNVVDQLKKTPLLKKLVAKKKIACVGAYYHLGSGKVELLTP